MPKKDLLSLILAANLRFFMDRSRSIYKNANTLGKAAGISPNTIRYYLDPTKRPDVPSKKKQGYPTLDKLQAIAEKLGCDVWELLHPDIARSLREREMYQKIQDDYLRLQAKDGRGIDKSAALHK